MNLNIIIANTQEFNPQIGGVERVSSTIAHKLVELGYKVYFVACLRSTFTQNYTPVVEQFILPEENYLSDSNKDKFISICVQNKINIILNQAGNILTFTRLCAIAARECNIPLISAIHINPLNRIHNIKDIKITNLDKWSYLKALRRLLLIYPRSRKIMSEDSALYKDVCKLSDKVVLLSNNYFNELSSFAGLGCLEKTLAIPNPRNDLVFVNNYNNKEKTLLYVGRLDFDHKRTDRLLAVWKNLYKDFPDWKLKLAGDGPNRDDLQRYVSRNNIKNVEFLGFCNANEHYARAPILCLTSTIEGLPMVLIEGISYGCIPISFDSFNSIFDIIEDGVNGFIIKSYNLRGYEAKLRLLMSNENLKEEMSKKAFVSSKKFDLEVIIKKWTALFEELAKEN